jgi:hypothetical protein
MVTFSPPLIVRHTLQLAYKASFDVKVQDSLLGWDMGRTSVVNFELATPTHRVVLPRWKL